MQYPLVLPMFALVLLSMAVLVAVFFTRLFAIRRREMKMSFFRTFSGGEPTVPVIKATRHFANLFEVPVLFYAGCCVAMIVGEQGPIVQGLAWFFVAARYVQAAIFFGANDVRTRLVAFALGSAATGGIWVAILAGILNRT